ncbi:MAG: hypothetical protein SFT93_04580, partial [Rickettsiaceae bacterium]|nr:hypothetical protein [Rickettsiaceae bacterium]
MNNSFDYINKYSTILANNIALLNTRDSKTIGDILQKTYTVAGIGSDITTLTKFDFVDPDGRVIANVTDGALKDQIYVNKSDREWMTLAPKEPMKLHITPTIVKGIVPNTSIIDYGIPAGMGVVNKKGKFLGIVSSGVDVNKLAVVLIKELEKSSLEFLILNDKYEFVASSAGASDNYNIIPSKIDKNTSRHNYKPSLLPSSINIGDTIYSAYARLENYPFIILIGENKYLASKNFRERVILPSFFCFFVSSLIFMLFLTFKHRVINPLKKLSDIASNISNGKYDDIVPTFNTEELSNLANQISKIQNYTHQINKLNKSLDQKSEELRDALIQKTKALLLKDEFIRN